MALGGTAGCWVPAATDFGSERTSMPDISCITWAIRPSETGWRSVRGTMVPTLSAPMLGALPVVAPPQEVQANTAEVLYALDDKIVAHERISRTTETLRNTLLVQLLVAGDNTGVPRPSVSRRASHRGRCHPARGSRRWRRLYPAAGLWLPPYAA